MAFTVGRIRLETYLSVLRWFLLSVRNVSWRFIMFIILLCVAWHSSSVQLFFCYTVKTFLLSLQRLLEVSLFGVSYVAKQTGNLIGNSVGKWKERIFFLKKKVQGVDLHSNESRTSTQQLLFRRTARKDISAFFSWNEKPITKSCLYYSVQIDFSSRPFPCGLQRKLDGFSTHITKNQVLWDCCHSICVNSVYKAFLKFLLCGNVISALKEVLSRLESLQLSFCALSAWKQLGRFLNEVGFCAEKFSHSSRSRDALSQRTGTLSLFPLGVFQVGHLWWHFSSK